MKGDKSTPPTIYDVARAAGVSSSTVSRAFARPGRVSYQTAQKVFRVAAELGYRAQPMARPHSPHGNRTSMIAIVVADIGNPVYSEMIRGAEASAAAAGYTMLLANTQESDRRERAALERAMPMVDGIVLSSSRMSDSAIRMIAKQKPSIVMNRAVTDVASVIIDNLRGVRRAAEHLGGLGHTTVGYLAGPDASWADGTRWRALREAALELELNARRFGPFTPTVSGGEQAAEEWMRHRTPAVLAYNDQIAIGFIRAVQASGLNVPGDVSVVGIDNIGSGELITPPLTSVAAPFYALGATAVSNLLAIAGGARPQSGEPVVLPTRLIVRGSTAPAGQAG